MLAGQTKDVCTAAHVWQHLNKDNVVSWAIGARRTAIVGWCAMGDIEGPATVVRQQVASGFIACETQNTGRGATGT